MDEGLARSYFIFLQDWFCRGHEILFSQLHEYPANPEVGHGMIKILKCLNFTRIGARALSNELRRENGVENLWKEKEHKRIKEDSSGRSGLPSHKLILEQLEEPVPKETEKAIESAERLRTNIKRLPENWRHKLVDSLQQKHVATMWMIAGYNYIDCAADLLPSVERKPPLTVKGKPPVLERKPPVWKGKIHRIFGNWPSSRMGYIFGNGHFKMRFSRDNNGLVYGEIVGGMKGLYYPIPKDAIRDSLHKKPCDFTFEYRNGEQQLAEPPQIGFHWITMMITWRERENEEQDMTALNYLGIVRSLRDCGPLKYFRLSGMRQQIELLEFLVRAWDPAIEAFHIKNQLVPITVEDVYFLTGFPRRGLPISL